MGGFYAQEALRLRRINRIKTIQGSLAIEGNTLATDQLDEKFKDLPSKLRKEFIGLVRSQYKKLIWVE